MDINMFAFPVMFSNTLLLLWCNTLIYNYLLTSCIVIFLVAFIVTV